MSKYLKQLLEQGEELALERWGKLPKTFDLKLTRNMLPKETQLAGQRRFLAMKGLAEYSVDEPLPDDFPMPLGGSAKSLLSWQKKVNDYNRINGTTY